MIGVVVFLIFISVVFKVASISFAAAVIIILAGFVVVLWNDAHESKKEQKKMKDTLKNIKLVLGEGIFYRRYKGSASDYDTTKQVFNMIREELKRQDGHY